MAQHTNDPPRVPRRAMLGLLSAGVASVAAARPVVSAAASPAAAQRSAAVASTYPVGIGNSSDPYAATLRAVQASGQWPGPALAGRTVVIKPNLVLPKLSSTGVTTDPQVVRALVDLALAAGAAAVQILEDGRMFGPCGYGFFSSYDPGGRVSLADLAAQSYVLTAIPRGLTYQSLYVPSSVLDPGVVFISAAKMKTHVDAVATLSMKNLFALATPTEYSIANQLPRADLHQRGVDQSIIDLNLARSVDFAVVDAIWGLEGNGPLQGTPVQLNLVLAGRNPVAVDRAGLQVMSLGQNAVPHLTYAAAMGLGPASAGQLALLGDPYAPYPFVPAHTPPPIWRPSAAPGSISVGAGQMTTISYGIQHSCWTRLEVIHDDEVQPAISLVRTLRDWTARSAGLDSVVWDGRDDNGVTVSPGRYLARVQARYGPTSLTNLATGAITVTS